MKEISEVDKSELNSLLEEYSGLDIRITNIVRDVLNPDEIKEKVIEENIDGITESPYFKALEKDAQTEVKNRAIQNYLRRRKLKSDIKTFRKKMWRELRVYLDLSQLIDSNELLEKYSCHTPLGNWVEYESLSLMMMMHGPRRWKGLESFKPTLYYDKEQEMFYTVIEAVSHSESRRKIISYCLNLESKLKGD